VEKRDATAWQVRFEQYAALVVRLVPLFGMLLIGILGTWLTVSFARDGQSAWAFSAFLLLTIFLLVATVLRPLEASSFEMAWAGLVRLLIHWNPKPQIEEKVEAALKALPVQGDERLKAAIVESVSTATQSAIRQIATKLEEVLVEARKQRAFSLAEGPLGGLMSPVRLPSLEPKDLYDKIDLSSIDISGLKLPSTAKPVKDIVTDVSGKQALGAVKPEKKTPPASP